MILITTNYLQRENPRSYSLIRINKVRTLMTLIWVHSSLSKRTYLVVPLQILIHIRYCSNERKPVQEKMPIAIFNKGGFSYAALHCLLKVKKCLSVSKVIKYIHNYLTGFFVQITLLSYRVLVNPFWITDTNSSQQLELSRDAYNFVVNCLLLHMPWSEIIEQGKLKGWMIPLQVLDYIKNDLLNNTTLGMTPQDFINDMPYRLRLPGPTPSRSPQEVAEILARIAAQNHQDYLDQVGDLDFDDEDEDVEFDYVVPAEAIAGCRMVVTTLIAAILVHHVWTSVVQSMDEEPEPSETSLSSSGQGDNTVYVNPTGDSPITTTSSNSLYEDPSLQKEDTVLNAFSPYSDLYYVLSLWLSIIFLFTLGISYLKWKQKKLNHDKQ
jgi:hypothetical protein